MKTQDQIRALYTERGLEYPEELPAGTPEVRIDETPFEYRKVPGVGFHRDDDGILFYYDEPIMFVAWIDNQRVIVTLLNEDYANDGMDEVERVAKNARGWQQHIAFPVSEDLLGRIVRNETPLRDLWEQEQNQNFFIHKDWASLFRGGEEREWIEIFRVYRDVPVKNAWKPKAGVGLNPDGLRYVGKFTRLFRGVRVVAAKIFGGAK